MNQQKDKYILKTILPFIRDKYELEGDPNAEFFSIEGFDGATEGSLIWCSPKMEGREDLIRNSRAAIVICDIGVSRGLSKNKTLVKTDNPRKTFMEIVNGMKSKEQQYGVHSTSVVHPDAEIHPESWIGPFSYIGKSKIGKGSVIHGHAYIYDNVTIGEDTVLEAGVVIGADGFGFQKNHDNDWERFPHLGGVIVEDNVEISSNATIDRGALGDTVIGRNTKISKEAHISHNVITGQGCIIAGGAMVSGSVKIGNDVWIGPNASLLNKVTIEDNVTISLGSVVTKDIKTGFTAVGSRIIPESMMKK
ncbi:MAG: DapH/DapD/GlmU-related protein [Bacteroidota bacterium]